MPFDFRPNVNIPAESMRPTQDPYNQILPMILQGQEHGRHLRSRQLIQGLMEDPALKADPSIAPFLPFIAAQPELLPQILPAMIRARGLAMKQKGGSQNMVQAITGPNGELRPDMPPQQQTPPPGLPAFPPGQSPMSPQPQEAQLGPGEVRGQMPFNQYTARMQGQESKKQGMRAFETTLTERTNKVVKPFDDALSHLDKLEAMYKAIPDDQLGPAAGRAGVGIGAITAGRKFSKAVAYRKYKQGLITQLLGPLGVNRFNLQEVNNVSQSIPSGTEDRVQGLQWIANMRSTLQKNKGQSLSNLQNEMMLYRAVMMPGQQNAEMPQEAPSQEAPDPSAFEE